MENKGDIRKRVLGLRDVLTADEIAARSARIVRRLTGLRDLRDASIMLVYNHFGSEVQTDGIIRWGWEKGKRIVVPFCRPLSRELIPCRIDGLEELETGHYGIREPKAENIRPMPYSEIDAILVPAVAFDRRGYRVGYGGGYYDRFLPQVPRAIRIGLAFSCQVVAEIPAEPHDVPVDRMVTEEEIIIP
jgi:5-formyltetrahydrofolate cyclo-ligase